MIVLNAGEVPRTGAPRATRSGSACCSRRYVSIVRALREAPGRFRRPPVSLVGCDNSLQLGGFWFLATLPAAPLTRKGAFLRGVVGGFVVASTPSHIVMRSRSAERRKHLARERSATISRARRANPNAARTGTPGPTIRITRWRACDSEGATMCQHVSGPLRPPAAMLWLRAPSSSPPARVTFCARGSSRSRRAAMLCVGQVGSAIRANLSSCATAGRCARAAAEAHCVPSMLARRCLEAGRRAGRRCR